VSAADVPKMNEQEILAYLKTLVPHLDMTWKEGAIVLPGGDEMDCSLIRRCYRPFNLPFADDMMKAQLARYGGQSEGNQGLEPSNP
jgi:hypothetical protein